jgi:hypothetical protein
LRLRRKIKNKGTSVLNIIHTSQGGVLNAQEGVGFGGIPYLDIY